MGDFWGSGGNGSAYSVDYKEVTTAGAEDPAAYTNDAEGWGTFTLAVRPAAGGGSIPIFRHHYQQMGAA